MEKEISKELGFDLEFVDGRVIISLGYEGKLGGAEIKAYADAIGFIDKVTDMIPGDLDDKILDALAEKLLAKKSDV